MYKLARHILILFLLVAGNKSFGQLRPVHPGFRRPPNFEQRVIARQQNKQNKVEQVRETYIGRRLALTPDESAKFWPIYRQYQDALTAVRQKKRINNSKDQPDGSEQIQNEL